jgi:hypothetical protein
MLAKNKNPWLVLIAFMIAHGVNDGFGWIIPPLLPFIREHFNLSYAEMGGIFSIFRFTSGIHRHRLPGWCIYFRRHLY